MAFGWALDSLEPLSLVLGRAAVFTVPYQPGTSNCPTLVDTSTSMPNLGPRLPK